MSNDNCLTFSMFDSNYNINKPSTIADNYHEVIISTNIQCNLNNLIDNGTGITHSNKIGIILSGNNFTDNWLTDTSVIDSGEVVMATSIYTCGPAALATILKKLGIYVTEAELAQIAGTDYM